MSIKDEIALALPELERIQSPDLRERCIAAIAEAMELGGWKSIAELESTPVIMRDRPAPGRIEFIREVAALASDELDELYEWIDDLAGCDRDTVIAAAVLADIGLYVTTGPNPVPNANMFNKAEWAGYIAQKNGLPERVVYTLLVMDPVMAPEGAKAIFTNEVRFVRSAYYTLLAALQ